ncbi:MAG: hypothetical protein IPL31_07065 [Saprospiraceae bacterium]|nr:hypothetical protein [Saprospiraceae bacterium]
MSKALTLIGCEVSLLAMNTSKHFVDLQHGYPEDLNYYKAIYSVNVDNRIRLHAAFKNIFSSDSYHISRFISQDFNDKLKEVLILENFDVIQLETLYLAPFLSTIKKYSNAMIVLRAHNIEHEIWQRIAKQVQFCQRNYI